MPWWTYPFLAGLGLVAGFINVMAGGGSLITMPAMIFLGLSPAAANGTNRIGLLLQNITAVARFRQKGIADVRTSLTLALCTLPGAVVGAFWAVEIDPQWFKRLLALVMVGVLVVTLRKRRIDAADPQPPSSRGARVLAHLGMVAVGFYGGFIQAGVGFVLMAILRGLLKLDLVWVNMHKVFIVGVYMIPSLAVFAILDQVFWLAGLALAAGTSVGAWLATRLQIQRGEGPVRVVFALAVMAMAIKLALG